MSNPNCFYCSSGQREAVSTVMPDYPLGTVGTCLGPPDLPSHLRLLQLGQGCGLQSRHPAPLASQTKHIPASPSPQLVGIHFCVGLGGGTEDGAECWVSPCLSSTASSSWSFELSWAVIAALQVSLIWCNWVSSPTDPSCIPFPAVIKYELPPQMHVPRCPEWA